MAKRWSGFVAQNNEIMEQWKVLEETRSQIEQRLESVLEEGEPEEDPEADLIYLEVK